jgi:hypothetical protein
MRPVSAIAFVLATVLGAMPGHAKTRVALVIRNAGYQNALGCPKWSALANVLSGALRTSQSD